MKLNVKFRDMKKDANYSLSGYRTTAFFICFWSLFIQGGASAIINLFITVIFGEGADWVGYLIILPFTSFIMIGFAFCMLKFSRDDIPYVRDLFRAGRFYPKYLLYQLLLTLFYLAIAYNLAVPMVLAILFARRLTFLLVLLILLGIAIIIALCVLLAGFFPVPYLILDNPNMKFFKLLGMSWKLMSGNKIRFVLFCLSFLGWGLLSILPYIIGLSIIISTGYYYFFIKGVGVMIALVTIVTGNLFYSYFSVAQCNFYNELVKQYKASFKSPAPPEEPAGMENQ